MRDISDLRDTIIPKSDQLNAEQLLSGPMTVTVTDVRLGNGDDQPVIVHYENDAGRPYKPCKTMRKVLIFAWGEDARTWAGKSMTLYNDELVKFGGMEVGGIRISHLTDIERDVQLSLTATKGKKALYVIKKLVLKPAPKAERPARTERHETMIKQLEKVAREEGFEAFKADWASLEKEDRAAIGTAERDRIAAIGQTDDSTTQETT